MTTFTPINMTLFSSRIEFILNMAWLDLFIIEYEILKLKIYRTLDIFNFVRMKIVDIIQVMREIL